MLTSPLENWPRIFATSAVLLASIGSAVAQNDSISLREFCPTKQWQQGATCASYATTYTALSTLHNVRNNATDESQPNFKAFSYGFVASQMKQELPTLDRLRSKCGLKVTSEDAMDVLHRHGTVEFSKFPDYCACGKLEGREAEARQYRTKEYSQLGDEQTNDTEHIAKIKQALSSKTPVVTSILQTSFFRDIDEAKSRFPAEYEKNDNASNHVVCILGYNDQVNGGSFLVRNNYEKWGKKGFSYIPYTDMIKLIRSSYVIVL